MPHLFRAFIAGAILVSGCSGKAEIGGEGAPSKKPNSPAAPPAAPTAPEHRHVLLVVEVEPGAHRATTLSSQVVELPLPTRRVPAIGPWRVEVLSQSGAVLYTAELPDAAALRGEFPNQNGQLEAVNARKAKTAVTLRLPLLADAATVRLVDASAAAATGASATGVELGRVAYPKAAP